MICFYFTEKKINQICVFKMKNIKFLFLKANKYFNILKIRKGLELILFFLS